MQDALQKFNYLCILTAFEIKTVMNELLAIFSTATYFSNKTAHPGYTPASEWNALFLFLQEQAQSIASRKENAERYNRGSNKGVLRSGFQSYKR